MQIRFGIMEYGRVAELLVLVQTFGIMEYGMKVYLVEKLGLLVFLMVVYLKIQIGMLVFSMEVIAFSIQQEMKIL